ncbi:MAG: EAL domain-containing protein [Sphingomonas bacterium]|nr:EAL domain-containing protein [Sphingomonas bacterium]
MKPSAVMHETLRNVDRLSGRIRRKATIGEAMALRTPSNPRDRAVRKAQLDAFVRLVPATLVTQLLVAAVLVATFRTTIDGFWLGLWFGGALVLCFARFVRAMRLRRDRQYALEHPASMHTICLIISALALLWLVPPLFWFEQADANQRLFLCVLVAALMSAGTLTMVSVPPAALMYVVLMLVASSVITFKLDLLPMLFLGLIYAAMLLWAVISNARHFIDHVRARFELEERGEIIQLLREFEASGSGGLWELDSELRLVNISHELASAIGRTVEDVIGMQCRDLLDPGNKASEFSTGMRSLFDHFARGNAFRDLAVPAFVSGRWWSLSGKPIRDLDGVIIGWRGVGSDITDLRLSGDDAVRAARRDPLTGLANRLLVRELLEESLLRQWREERDCGLLLVDLDRFKLVNDTLGHAIGDQLLVEVARRLEASVGSGGRVGRLGGDEFAIVWHNGAERDTLAALADRIITDLSRSFRIGAASLHVGATLGIARGPVDGAREELLMRNADLALYRAKKAGRGGYAFFEYSMFEAAEDHRLLENDVRNALNGDGLQLAYQPIINSASGAVVGREALLRWRHPTRGDIPPDLFVPIIEDAGLIHQIGDWVIREACAEAASWPEPLTIAVNISAAQLTGAGLAQTVLGALAASGLDPARLELEVTESVFLGDDATTLTSLERLRALGVRMVLDDFGKGYSSFGYLSRAKFSKIKIDQSFVRAAADGERESVAIVHAILALARGLGVETTAEGVETAAQAKVMRRLGCTQLQGFLFGRPVSAELLRGDDPEERLLANG